jgi:hypothetical protein
LGDHAPLSDVKNMAGPNVALVTVKPSQCFRGSHNRA